MILTIEFESAEELRSKIVDLAGLYSDSPSQETVQNFATAVPAQEQATEAAVPAQSSNVLTPTVVAPEKKKRGRPAFRKDDVAAAPTAYVAPTGAAVPAGVAAQAAAPISMTAPSTPSTPISTPAPVSAPTASQTAPAPTLDDVRKAMTPVMAKHGVPGARAIFEQFKAQRFPELNPADYAQVIAACNQAVLKPVAA